MAHNNIPESNASQWPKFGGFKELRVTRKEIRVLHLDTTEAGNLKYSMLHRDINAQGYSALSYSWGAPIPATAMRAIQINKETVTIRPTLHSALMILATRYRDIDIWIDAICINQANIEERNRQISMMDEIYSNAEKVFVWLGRGDDDTNYALDHIENSIPQTDFDPRQFELSVEKLFQASYWTRRWVIQEFALAQQLLVVCGLHIVTWDRMIKFVTDRVSEPDRVPLPNMEQFKQLQLSDNRMRSSLLDLMVQFNTSRCIDRRDKAFALRGIAEDGELLTPDYSESVGDVFFRLLSFQPTVGVLPAMQGYRWPQSDATRLSDCLTLRAKDLLGSLTEKSSDRLYVVLEFVGEVSSTNLAPQLDSDSSFPWHIQMKQTTEARVYGSRGVRRGDQVYSLSTSQFQTSDLHVSFRPNSTSSGPSGILLTAENDDWRYRGKHLACLEMVERICLHGITNCVKNTTARTSTERLLCHISRATMILLWLTAHRKESLFLHHQNIPLTNDAHHRCGTECNYTKTLDQSTTHSKSYLEIMPMAWDIGNSMAPINKWAGAEVNLFTDVSQDSGDENLPMVPQSASHTLRPDLYRHLRSNLAVAAANGLLTWTRDLLPPSQPNPDGTDMIYYELQYGKPDNLDEVRRPPLSLAATSGNEEVVRLLLNSGNVDPNQRDYWGKTALDWAIDDGDEKVVSLLLSYGSVEPHPIGKSGRTSLSRAAWSGFTEIVKIMLASGRVEPDSADVDGMTPLLWAARHGFTEIVKLLLDTKKVNCNSRDLTGRTPLSHAAERGSESMTRLLLAQADIEPDLMDHERITPLRWATTKNHPKICELLLATGKVRPIRT